MDNLQASIEHGVDLLGHFQKISIARNDRVAALLSGGAGHAEKS
jgi:hypothetical protein